MGGLPGWVGDLITGLLSALFGGGGTSPTFFGIQYLISIPAPDPLTSQFYNAQNSFR
jgi:hypothetical protein